MDTRWAPRESSRLSCGDCITMAWQSVFIRKIIKFLGRMSVIQTPCEFCWPSTADTESADKIGRVKPPLVVRALSRMSTLYLDNNIQFGVRTWRHALELRDEQGMCCLQRDNMTEEQTAGLKRPMAPSRHTNMHQI